MGKLEMNKRLKLNALYNTAFELFTTKGISKTTISDIVDKAGVAKGTFYLYFRDKLDIRDKLVSHKAQELLRNAHHSMIQEGITGFVPQIHFLVDNIIDCLSENPALLVFIHKNLSWGVFKSLMNEKPAEDGFDFYEAYLAFLSQDESISLKEPELVLFSIIELVSGTCFQCIIHQQPVTLEQYRPFLHQAIDGILDRCL